MDFAYGWSQEDAGARAPVCISPRQRPQRNWVVGEKSVLLPPRRRCAIRVVGSRLGGLQTLGSLKAPCKPLPTTPPDTAVRRLCASASVSAPLVAKRNSFCDHPRCEVHSCSVLLALCTFEKAEYGVGGEISSCTTKEAGNL